MTYDITYATIPGSGAPITRTMRVQSSLPTPEIWALSRRMAHRTEYTCEGDRRPLEAYVVTSVEVVP